MYKWPLSDSNFTWLDRLKICKFFLNPKRQWTEGEEVRKFQKLWAEYTGAQYVIMTSSGSTANTLIAQYIRDTNKEKNIIVTQPVGWMTSYSPFIREGFDLHFIDVSLKNLSMDLDKLEKYLKKNHKQVAAVFIVCILGFAPDMDRLKSLEADYGVKICLDNCEGSNSDWNYKSINNYFTTSTSLYFSHIHTCGTESGLIFTQDKEEFKYFQLAKHNGLVRVLEPYIQINKTGDELGINELEWNDVETKYNLKLKDSRFDFCQLGNNYRSSDINAYIADLDFVRNQYYNDRRQSLYNSFAENIDIDKYHLIYNHPNSDVPFAIPIIIKGETKKEKDDRFLAAIQLCEKLSIEYRMLVSGNVLRQRAFENLGVAKNYKVAEELHNYAFYIGLNPKLARVRLLHFVSELNNI